LPQAASLAASIRERLGIAPEVLPGDIGMFDVVVDGRVVYSKQKTGKFPVADEVIARLGGQ